MRTLLLMSSLALGAGLARRAEPQPRPPVRPALDEMLEEQRGTCDAHAGDALQDCLRAASMNRRGGAWSLRP